MYSNNISIKTQLPEMGKVSAQILDEIVLPQLGRKRTDVLVGPKHGVDVGIIDLGHGQVMATTTDPIFVVPAYGWERSAWFAIHILASDAVTSGLKPRYITLDLNLPLSMERENLEIMWETMHRECDRIGMAVVSGHTGRYQGCEYPMMGGATVMCLGSKENYVTPTMAQVGDVIIITKGAGIEATGLFAVTFPDQVASAYGKHTADAAQEIFWQMSVVEDAMTAVQAGVREQGVTSMHDATECGVWGGLVEVAQAAKVGMIINKEAIILPEIVTQICTLFEIDPYTSISEGTLIITCRPHKAKEVLQRLHDRGIPSSVVGGITLADEGIQVVENGHMHPLVHPQVDPFWAAFSKAAAI